MVRGARSAGHSARRRTGDRRPEASVVGASSLGSLASVPSERVFWPYGGSLCVWVVWTSPDVGGARGGEFAADHSQVQVCPDLARELMIVLHMLVPVVQLFIFPWRLVGAAPIARWIGAERLGRPAIQECRHRCQTFRHVGFTGTAGPIPLFAKSDVPGATSLKNRPRMLISSPTNSPRCCQSLAPTTRHDPQTHRRTLAMYSRHCRPPCRRYGTFQRDRLPMMICARFLGHSPLMCRRVSEGDPGEKKPTVVIARAARRLSFRRTRRDPVDAPEITDEGVATADLRDGKKLIHRGRPVTLWRIVAEFSLLSGRHILCTDPC